MTKPNRTKEYRKIWEEFYGEKIPSGMHIHHIDGDHANNSIQNLALVTAEDHYRIHKENGDTYAAYLIMKHFLDVDLEELSKLSSERMKRTHIEYVEKHGKEAYSKWQSKRKSGKPHTEDHKKKLGIAAKNRFADPIKKELHRNSLLGKKKRKLTCPHCGLHGGGGNMYRYHFDKCTQMINNEGTKTIKK